MIPSDALSLIHPQSQCVTYIIYIYNVYSLYGKETGKSVYIANRPQFLLLQLIFIRK